MEAYGRHLLLEMWDCNRYILNDPEKITQIMCTAANDAGATVVKSIYHEFNPPGITAVAILSESHISVHTWPIEGYVAVDVFTCGTVADPQLAIKSLLEGFEPKEHTSVEIKRGSPFIKETMLSKVYSVT
ncbi:MAG: adenosylmethionine decarboxylase [Candidatus Scalindua rubra]|uniref:S-adenosylmethionine decarboxylase proenzyme n=1 Tax=Candidatus Scalindua brodae TaxID=237368 RepID=A0A0B0EN49_9BACT|nr:MAG: S-adenosylmethionine decarboxylase proenzyme [Candidatus Scalindua brodae]MBZ0110547.1 adenosylmethionine decarboxylase [Candidatus Scalindua rubra]TWU30787.1 S-adenosylmethionine decarboxylase proenzyme precursor [Candidatus Brocadiaceae bacterium S225]